MSSTAVQHEFDIPSRPQPAHAGASAGGESAQVLLLPSADPASLAANVGAQAFAHLLQTVRSRPLEFALLALFSIAFHLLVMQFFSQPHAEEEVKPPVIPEMTIEFARPLPQAATPTPVIPQPRPQPQPKAPPVSRQAAPAKTQTAAPVTTASTSSTSSDAVKTDAPPAPPVAAAPVEEPLTEPKGRAGYLNNPAPEYPAQAQRQNWEGDVLLRVHVLASGRPDSVEIQKTSGKKVLDQAAVTAVQSWIFVPAKRGQRPVDGWVTVPIEFKLGG